MGLSMEQILNETKQLIAVKTASFRKKGEEATTNPPESIGTMKTVDEEAKKPTPKQDPKEEARNLEDVGGRDTAGAGTGSTLETRKDTLDAGEQADATVTKKPVLSDDANAKSASLANHLIQSIRAFQVVNKQACDAAKAAAPQKGVNPFAKKDDKDEAKAPEAKAPEAKAPEAKEAKAPEAKEAKAPETKEAGEIDGIELTTDVMAKIAAIVLAEKEGMELAEKLLAKAAGAEGAKEVLGFVFQKAAEAKAAEDYAKGASDAQALINQQIATQGFQAGFAKAAELGVKINKGQKLTEEDMQFLKLGQAIGEQAMADLGGAEGAPAGGMPPEAMAGGMPPEAMAGAGGEEISMEELAAALDQLVQSGVIKPEEVQQLMEYLASAGGGEAQGAGAPPAPAEATPDAGETENKEAAAKKVKTDKINKLANALAAQVGAIKASAVSQKK